MAYYFPTSYQPYQMTPQMPSQNSGVIWIQGEAAAKSYLVAPNTTVALWDSEAQSIYLKSADASGMPSMRVLDYTIRDNVPKMPQSTPLAAGQDFPTREEFNALKGQIKALQDKIERGGGDESSVSKLAK